MIADDGTVITNWPVQHNANGIEKNNRTNRRYKYLVRILKSLRDEMEQAGVASARSIPRGFLLECLAYNVTDPSFAKTNLTETLVNVLLMIISATRNEEDCSSWTEVSELKLLFDVNQKWSRIQVFHFANDALKHIGYEK